MKYLVISPDGIPDRPEPYNTREEAEAAKKAFCERFALQGFYSSPDGRISLEDLPACVTIRESPDGSGDFCDECGAEYPMGAKDMLGDFHERSCSLHPSNSV